ncbi:MAG TPA: creatininase family protein [bacterium]|nr:creatininase family protein [bacterium]
MSSSPRLAQCTWTEARERFKAACVAIVPSGANEAAGPHLPTSADTIMAEEMCVRGAAELQRRGVDSLVLPTLPYGASYASYPFPGTIVLTPTAIQAVMTDVGRSVERHGLSHLLLASAHLEPGHLSALQAAGYILERETRLKVSVLDLREPRWAGRLSEEFRSGARHAGSYATSLVLAARPDLVHMDVARTLAPVWINLLDAIQKGARTFDQVGSDLAYFGEPAKASAEEGERLFQALGTIIADAVEELLRR